MLLSQGIHTLDLMLSLAGPIIVVGGFALTSPVHEMETEGMVCATARFANGAVGIIDATTAAYPGFSERIKLICRHAMASLVGTALDIAWHDGTHSLIEADKSTGGTGADPMAFPHDYHRAVMADFTEPFAKGDRPRSRARMRCRSTA